MNILLREMFDTDWKAVRNIYLEGIATGNATFEKSAPPWKEWNKTHLPSYRFVAEVDNKIVGWATLSSISNRCISSECISSIGIAEVSIYVTSLARGKKIGYHLLSKLVTISEEKGLWTIVAGIFPENIASIMLHKKCGFREVGYQEKLGKVNDKWRDVFLFERRSRVIK